MASRPDEAPLAPITFVPRYPRLKRFLSALLPGWRHLFEAELKHFAGMTPGTVLDVGCGAGQFLRMAIGGGWKAVGIDFDTAAVAEAARVAGAEVHVMDISTHVLDDRRFEGILLDNVIEHLPDLPRVVQRLSHLLAPGGRLVMITPKIESNTVIRSSVRTGGGLRPHVTSASSRRERSGRLAAENGLHDRKSSVAATYGKSGFMAEASAMIASKRGQEPPPIDVADLERMIFLQRPARQGDW